MVGYASLTNPAAPSLHHQRHAPDRLAIEQQPHRLGVIRQRQAVRDVGAQLALLRTLQQRLEAHFAERGVSPHRFAGAHAQNAGALDQQEIGLGRADAAGEADDAVEEEAAASPPDSVAKGKPGVVMLALAPPPPTDSIP